MFWAIDGAKTNFERIEMIQNVFSNHKKIKLEIEYRKIAFKYTKFPNILKLTHN